MQNWAWKNIMVPGILGIFFALGQFVVYMLSKTKPALTLQSWIVVDDKNTKQTIAVDKVL